MAQITLEKVVGNSFYVTGRLSIGLYLVENEKSAVLIDSGLDSENAKKVDKAIKSLGYRISAVINTHSHADHCGGNSYFQKTYPDLRIFATDFESHFIEEPYLEPLTFCCGSFPFKGLRVRLLEAEKSHVTDRIPYIDGKIKVNNTDFSVLTLPGHTDGMIGIITPDEVLYYGDAIFGQETYEKHGVLFYTDIEKIKETFNKLKTVDVRGHVLYHGSLVENPLQIIENHEKKIEETEKFILDVIMEAPISLESLIAKIMNRYKIDNNIVQHSLTSTCVRSYISYLESNGLIALNVEDGFLTIRKM